MNRVNDGISADELCRRVGVTYRVLDYWCRTGVLTPVVRGRAGPGGQRRFSAHDVRLAHVLDMLRRAGATTDVLAGVARQCADVELAGGVLAVSPAGDCCWDRPPAGACWWTVDLDRLSGGRFPAAALAAAPGAAVV